MLGVEVVERVDAAVLPDLGSRLGGEDGKAPNPARRLQRRVARVEDRRAESPVERLLDPLRRESVRAQGLVLDRELVALLVVGGEPEAAGAPGGVARERRRAGRAPASVWRQ